MLLLILLNYNLKEAPIPEDWGKLTDDQLSVSLCGRRVEYEFLEL